MKIGILYTGGTIGSVSKDANSPLSPMSGDDFSKAFNSNVLPIIQKQYSDSDPDLSISFIPIQFDSPSGTLDSTNLQPSNWCTMVRKILSNYNSYDAFIVLHGTDTMAWTASVLSFLMTGLDNSGNPIALLSKPIVVTGSQLPLFYADGSTEYIMRFNTDAFQNVCGAVTACYEGVPEVCLYFDATLMRGNRTVKTNASEFKAFSSPNYPNLAEYGVEFRLDNKLVRSLPTIPSYALDDDTAYQTLSTQLEYITANIDNTIVMPFLAFPAYYNDNSSPNTSVLSNILSASLAQEVNGLILESYGEGNFPSGNIKGHDSEGAIYQTLYEANKKGVVLIDCTQVLTGIVNSQAYASGSWLSQVGAIGAYDMTPIAALTKLIYLITLAKYNNNNWSQSKIKELMITNLVGEIMDINVLNARGEQFLAPGESIIALDGSATLLNDPEQGPILKSSDNKVVYSFPLSGTPRFPGRLYMQEDGNLVFYDRDNQALYASDSADLGTRTSKLILEGDYYTTKNLKLYVQNYNEGPTQIILYNQAS